MGNREEKITKELGVSNILFPMRRWSRLKAHTFWYPAECSALAPRSSPHPIAGLGAYPGVRHAFWPRGTVEPKPSCGTLLGARSEIGRRPSQRPREVARTQ